MENEAIVVAKSSITKWAGGNKVSAVFGATRNQWNLNLSFGGSSGGLFAALASGQIWLDTVNDLGGSFRSPAFLNGNVG